MKTPESKKHYGPKNANTTLTVQAHRAEGDSICVELGEGKDSMKPVAVGEEYKPASSARLVMAKKEAAHYPVGSKVVLHCVPAKEGAEGSGDDGWGKFMEKYEEDD